MKDKENYSHILCNSNYDYLFKKYDIENTRQKMLNIYKHLPNNIPEIDLTNSDINCDNNVLLVVFLYRINHQLIDKDQKIFKIIDNHLCNLIEHIDIILYMLAIWRRLDIIIYIYNYYDYYDMVNNIFDIYMENYFHQIDNLINFINKFNIDINYSDGIIINKLINIEGSVFNDDLIKLLENGADINLLTNDRKIVLLTCGSKKVITMALNHGMIIDYDKITNKNFLQDYGLSEQEIIMIQNRYIYILLKELDRLCDLFY